MAINVEKYNFDVVQYKCIKNEHVQNVPRNEGAQETNFLICDKCNKYKWFTIYDDDLFKLYRSIHDKFNIEFIVETSEEFYKKQELQEKYKVANILFTLIRDYIADPCDCGGKLRYTLECKICGSRLDRIGKKIIRTLTVETEKLTHNNLGELTEEKIEELSNIGKELLTQGNIVESGLW